jgi:hypothetical protein
MAKTAAKKTPPPTPEPATPPPELASDPPPGEVLERVSLTDVPDFAADEAELGAEPTLYRWHLSRAVFRGAKREWETCTSYPAGAGVLTADVIREDWGPGTYYAQLRPAAGSGVGHGGVAKTRTFTLAAPRGPTAAPGVSSTTEALLQKMLEAQQRGFEQLGQLLAARPGGGADPAAMLDLAMRMAERMSPKRESDPLEQIDRWAGLFERLRTGKDWTDLISEGITTVRPLVDVAVQKLGGIPAAASADAAPSAAPAITNGSGGAPKVEGPMWQLQLANYLRHQARYLIGKARTKASANLYAEVVLDNLPEAVTFPQMLELLKQPNALQRVLDQLPAEERVAAERERAWFEELVREMIGFLEAQVGGAPPPGGDSGAAKDDTPVV